MAMLPTSQRNWRLWSLFLLNSTISHFCTQNCFFIQPYLLLSSFRGGFFSYSGPSFIHLFLTWSLLLKKFLHCFSLHLSYIVLAFFPPPLLALSPHLVFHLGVFSIVHLCAGPSYTCVAPESWLWAPLPNCAFNNVTWVDWNCPTIVESFAWETLANGTNQIFSPLPSAGFETCMGKPML